MKILDQKILERLDSLIQNGSSARSYYLPGPPNVIGKGHIDHSFFNEWKNSSENLIIKITGENSHYYKNFIDKVKNPWLEQAEMGVGILKALKADIGSGFLTDVRELVTAEILTDFLEMAKHLLDAGYKDPSASLIGAVLEDGLRKMCKKMGY